MKVVRCGRLDGYSSLTLKKKLLIYHDIPFKSCDFIVIDIFADFTPELFYISIGAILFELVNHLSADARDGGKIIRACRVQA